MSKQTFLIPNQSAQRAVMLDVWNLVSTLTADERKELGVERGVLVSDLLLAWLDPRIRFGGGQAR